MSTVFRKAPADTINVDVDFAAELPAGVTISNISWNVPAGLSQGATSSTSTVAQSYFSSGVDGATYSVECVATTSASPPVTLARTFFVKVGQVFLSQSLASLAVDLAEAKNYLRVTTDDDDQKIQATIEAATQLIESHTNKTFISKHRAITGESFASLKYIPGQPIQAVVAVRYYDTANILQTLGSSVWGTRSEHGQTILSLLPGQSWPVVYARPDAVRVDWFAGYGDAPSQVPALARAAVLMLTRWMYDNPGLEASPKWLSTVTASLTTGEVVDV